jgi:hypothetical protein
MPAGDFDGDGAIDLAVGFNNIGGRPPEVAVVFGPFGPGQSFLLDDPRGFRVLRISDAMNPKHFGEWLGPIGDFNGDGRDDLAFYNPMDAGCCGMEILLGHDPWADAVDLAELKEEGLSVKFGFDSGAFFALRFKPAGDVNGDGFEDALLFGTSFEDDNSGAVGVLLGRKALDREASLFSEVQGDGGFLIRGDEPVGFFGYDADVADLDGDARPDILVGSYRCSELRGEARPGVVHIAFDIGRLRGESSISDLALPVLTIEGELPMDRFGVVSRILGDQNADGLPEVLIEAYFDTDEGGGRGRTFLVPGSSLAGPARPFMRGDPNLDGKPELTDAVYIFGVLFLGMPGFPCQDAADVNDDGTVNITDGVYLLLYLFLGGLPPREPFPDRGRDPTNDDPLSCRGA